METFKNIEKKIIRNCKSKKMKGILFIQILYE